MPQHIECVAAYFLYNLAYNVCFEVLRFNVFEYFWQGGYGCVGGVHKDYVAGFQVFVARSKIKSGLWSRQSIVSRVHIITV